MYTDSRGQNISTSRLASLKTYRGSHVDALQRKYLTDHFVCPFSHTTIVDFVGYARANDLSRYDAIVLHCGIVDFSPRPISNIKKIQESKRGQPLFDELFAANAAHHAQASCAPYDGEPTTTLYTHEYLGHLLETLASIDGLIWVSSNSFVPGWDGNWRPRPTDIDSVVTSYDQAMGSALARVVDLREWSHEDVKRNTVDNVHFTSAGFEDVQTRLLAALRGTL